MQERAHVPMVGEVHIFSKTFLVFETWPDLTKSEGTLCSKVGLVGILAMA
jgi:hypothetical protein